MELNETDKVFHTIGFAGSIILTLSFIPITYSKIKNKDYSLNPYFSFLIISSSLLLLLYSVYFIIIPMVIANLSVLLNNLVLVYLFFKNPQTENQYKSENI